MGFEPTPSAVQKPPQHILARAIASTIFVILQGFCESIVKSSSTTY